MDHRTVHQVAQLDPVERLALARLNKFVVDDSERVTVDKQFEARTKLVGTVVSHNPRGRDKAEISPQSCRAAAATSILLSQRNVYFLVSRASYVAIFRHNYGLYQGRALL